MRHKCCVCGESIRFSVLMGDQGQRLLDGYVCYSCSEKAGYSKDIADEMELALIRADEFRRKLDISPQKDNGDNPLPKKYNDNNTETDIHNEQANYSAEANPNNDLAEFVRNNFTTNEYLQAIKYVKETTRWGLKEAKDYVDGILK